MQYFNFSSLINKYKSKFTAIILEKGEWNEKGEWQNGTKTEIELEGAIISHKESKIYRSEGTLTAKDKRLFVLKPLENALYGSQILFDGNVYSIEDNTENAKFTGVYAYTLKYVSAFKEGDR